MTFSAPTGVGVPRASISGYKVRNAPNFTPEQMNLFSQLLGGAQQGIGQGLGSLSNLASGSEEGFDQLEAPSYSAFDKLLGQIGTRFAGMGAIGSSAFQNATSGAAQSLAENLGSQRMGLQQDAVDRLLSLANQLLGQRPYDTFLEKKGPSRSAQFGNILGKALPSLLSLL